MHEIAPYIQAAADSLSGMPHGTLQKRADNIMDLAKLLYDRAERWSEEKENQLKQEERKAEQQALLDAISRHSPTLLADHSAVITKLVRGFVLESPDWISGEFSAAIVKLALDRQICGTLTWDYLVYAIKQAEFTIQIDQDGRVSLINQENLTD